MMKEYLASTRSVDRNLGRVMAELDKSGLAENTIVIYTSDHGYNMGHHGIWHKGNGHWGLNHPVPRKGNIGENQRPNMWENSIRVPSIVRWPELCGRGASSLITSAPSSQSGEVSGRACVPKTFLAIC